MQKIKGFEKYSITKEGNVFSSHSQRFLNNFLWGKYRGEKGYFFVNLFLEGKGYKKSIHRLLAETYIPNPNNYKYVDHFDKDTTNNSLENLRWASGSQNSSNRTKAKNKTSKYYGVSFDKSQGSWRAKIHYLEGEKRIQKYSRHKTENEAAKAYNEMAKAIHKEFATLNVII